MPSDLHAFLISLTYPLALSGCLLLCAVSALALRRRRLGWMLTAFALAWSLLWSVPQCSDWLRATLEHRYPVVAEAALPQADAIVVLGGGGRYDWLKRENVRPQQLRSSRLAAGARAWLAGRAPVVVLSGGGAGGRSEAQNMAAAIARLGIPTAVLMLEERSRNTRDNASFTAKLAEQHGMQHVLLVTSALHMPRASLLFRQAGVEVTAVPVPERAAREDWADRWVPSGSALWRSGRALKEYAGLMAVCLQADARAGGVRRASSTMD